MAKTKHRLLTTFCILLFAFCIFLTACGDKSCDHTYDNACDVTCNKCGVERTITHDYADADCDTPKTCKICGKTEGEALGHTPAEDDGDCSTEVKCTVCGEVTTPAGQHTPNDDDGDCTTEITCSVCGTITTPAKDSHTGGTATCTAKAECTECGTAYGTVDGNNHIDENTDHICDRECGKTDIGTHADSAEDNDHVCDYGCGEILNNHEGGNGTATCEHGKICDVCGEYYGDPLPHNYTYTANDDANTITVTCNTGCTYSKTITLKAPENAVYTGEKQKVTVTGADDDVSYDLLYNAEPINAGKYTVTLYVGDKSVSVEFTIEKANATATAPTANTLTYDGSAQALVAAGSATGGEMQYSIDNITWSTTIPTGTDAGDYTVYYKVVGDDNHNDVAAQSVTVTIKKATASVTTAPKSVSNLFYNGSAQALITAGSATGGTMQYKLGEDGTYSTEIPTAINAGSYTVYYKVVGNDNYNDSAETFITVTIGRAAASVTKAPEAVSNLIYNGSAQALVTAGLATGGTMQYKLGEDGTYSTEIPTATNAGTYTVYYKVEGDVNHNDSAEMSIEVGIAKATPTKNDFIFTLRGEPVNYGYIYAGFYDGNALTFSAKVKDGIVGMGTITVYYDGSNEAPTDARDGTYFIQIEVSEGDNYEGITLINVFGIQISTKPLTEDDVTVGNLNASYVYTGEQITPEITVVVDSRTLVEDTDYTVSYENNVYVGTATVTITFKENYEGTITKTFEITRDPDTKEFEGEWVIIPEE